MILPGRDADESTWTHLNNVRFYAERVPRLDSIRIIPISHSEASEQIYVISITVETMNKSQVLVEEFKHNLSPILLRVEEAENLAAALYGCGIRVSEELRGRI